MAHYALFRRKRLAVLVAAAAIGANVALLSGCSDDDDYDDSALQSQVSALETQLDELQTDAATTEALLELSLKQQPVGFLEVPTPVTDAEKRAILASDYAVVETNSYDIAEIGFHTILRSGEYASDTDDFAFGTIVDENGAAVTATDGSLDISNSNDFASLLTPVGGGLFMVSHFEDRPAAMYITELEQDPATGLLSALRSKPLDFSADKGGWVHCAGSVTPWGTHLGSEEYEPDADAWDSATGEVNDYYNAIAPYFGGDLTQTHPYYYGWQVEVNVPDYDSATVTKHYAMGRVAHELGYVMPDEKTAYISDDGTDVGLFMFVADGTQDLSSGTLYVARWNQSDDQNGGSATLEWINLGNTDDATIRAAIDAGIVFEDIFDKVQPDWTDTDNDGARDIYTVDSYTCPAGYTMVEHTYSDSRSGFNTPEGIECLSLQPGNFNGTPIEELASRLETRRYAAMLGATTEFRKMEGITYNPNGEKLYIAMSEVNKGMLSGDMGNAGLGEDIILPQNDCGVVYESNINGATVVQDADGIAIDSEYVATNMSGLVVGVPTSYDASSPYAGNTCDVNGIANPDNITFLPGRDTLIIGEDTGSGHQNDIIWSYNLTRDELTRIQTTPYGSETTSPYFYPNINGYAYLMSVIQHPYGESDEDQLTDVLDARAYTGYVGPFPAMD